MSDAATGEIRMFGGPYAPENWHYCDGSLLSINQYQALYSLIGTAYGGDGRTTFGIPNLNGNVPIGQGQGTGLTNRVLGQTGGSATAALTAAQMPAHTHQMMAVNAPATSLSPVSTGFAQSVNSNGGSNVDGHYLKPTATTNIDWTLNTQSVQTVGYGQAHENRMPSMVMNYIICLNGIYPNF